MENLKDINSNTEKFVDKSVHQTLKGSKPVGYGSSIQNSGNGSKARPHEQKEDEKDNKQDAIKEKQ
ncbi:hypothetical protein WG904_18355 [Pedobacter sp. Du54]|uniref:hypothetical protein n=1 Tax=Pedobacter anseongensis TaxID=3133439 RepID=UPI0030B048D3